MRTRVFFVGPRSPSTLAPITPQEKWYNLTLVNGLERVFDEAISDIISPGDLVAVKMHFGERYTRHYLRPIYVRRLVEKIKEVGGKPFVTDTLFGGYKVVPPWTRRGFENCLLTAQMNGFTQETVGAPILIADGPSGLRSINVEINGSELKNVHVAPAIADADVLISLAHFKGHDITGAAGALKNLAPGCLSKRGKYWIHYKDKVKLIEEKCTLCGMCVDVCPPQALKIEDGKITLNSKLCIDCGFCLEVCKEGVLSSDFTEIPDQIGTRIGESAAAVIKLVGKEKCGFMNLAIDVTPLCDCDCFTDVPFVPDIGVLGSKDPVAVDRACCDLVTAAPGIPDSMAEDASVLSPGMEKLNAIAKLRWLATPDAKHIRPDWKVWLKAAENMGIGTQDYEFTKIQRPL